MQIMDIYVYIVIRFDESNYTEWALDTLLHLESISVGVMIKKNGNGVS